MRGCEGNVGELMNWVVMSFALFSEIRILYNGCNGIAVPVCLCVCVCARACEIGL